MKKAARIFYQIGKWLQLAIVILLALMSLGFLIWFIIALIADGFEYAAPALGSFLGSLFYLAVAVACWIVIGIAIKKQKADSKNKVPHIMCIVAGVFSNVCYIVGGILSLIMISKGQEVEPIQTISKEQVQSAVKKDKTVDVESKEKEEPKGE